MTHGLREDNLLTVEQLKTDKEPHHFTVAASLFLLYLSLGSLYFTLTDESLSFLDSLYFLIVSFTTTGYGDIVASQGGSRAMISLLILLGMITMGYVAAVFSDLFANKLHKQILKRNKRVVAFLAGVGKARNIAVERAAQKTGLFRYISKKLRVAWLWDPLSGHHARNPDPNAENSTNDHSTVNPMRNNNPCPEDNVDNSECSAESDSTVLDNPAATVDDIKEMSVQSFDYELKKANSKALYSVICILTIVLLGSAVISAVETWPFIDAVYWAIVTITTVGYGDITPKTASGRAFCIVYILLGSLVVARAISVFIQYPLLMRSKRLEMRVLEQFKHLPAQTLAAISHSFQQGAFNFLRPPSHRSGASASEIEKAEFILVLLEMTNKLSAQDILLASRVFDSMDITCNGVISAAELLQEAQRAGEREKEERRAEEDQRSRARSHSASIRMVPTVFSPLVNMSHGTECDNNRENDV